MSKATVSVKTSDWKYYSIFFPWNGLMQMLQNTRLWFLRGNWDFFEVVRTLPSRHTSTTVAAYFWQQIFRQSYASMHHGRRRSSLLPAVTLGVRDKEQSSNQPVSRFTTERSLRPLSRVQPEHQASPPFLSRRVFTLRHRAGPQPKISPRRRLLHKTLMITAFAVNNQLRSAENTVQTAITENHCAEKYSQDFDTKWVYFWPGIQDLGR